MTTPGTKERFGRKTFNVNTTIFFLTEALLPTPTHPLRFGEDVLDRVVEFVASELQLADDTLLLDIGCGNGNLLVQLEQSGYRRLVGVDYSQVGTQ